MHSFSILVRLLILCLVRFSCGFKKVINKPGHRFEEEEFAPQERYTLFWDRRQEKVTRYLTDNKNKIRINPEKSSTLNLPDDVINNFRKLTSKARSKTESRQKVLEISNYNVINVYEGRVNQNERQNKTCTTNQISNCTYSVIVPYMVCTPTLVNRRNCMRYRTEQRTGLCNKIVTSCCKGYKLGPDNYCAMVRSETDSGCGGNRFLRNRTGILSTPDHPNKYERNLNCRWTIEASRGDVVLMSLMDLNMENPIGYCNLARGDCMNLCEFDVLTVQHSLTNRSRTLCGSVLPQMSFSYPEGSIEITFTSDSSNQGRGFKLAYGIVPGSSLTPRSCFFGQTWHICRRDCMLTCVDVANPNNGPWAYCLKSIGNNRTIVPTSAQDDIICVPGCACPKERPIWHQNRCIKVDACPRSSFICGKPVPTPSPKILGGSTSRDGAWPWMVQITKNSLHADCAGSLICSDWLITAAHCFVDRAKWSMPQVVDVNLFWFHLGKYWKYEQQDGRKVESYRAQRIIVHPLYNFTTDLNDIALVKLSAFARQWNRIRPICLPPPMPEVIQTEKQWANIGRFPQVGDRCIATGWGVTRGFGPSSNRLKQLLLPIKPESQCSYSNFDWRRIICAGGLVNADTCQGDSGGPLMCYQNDRWQIHGITSFGNDCGLGVPGGYTRVSNYVPWIRQHVGYACQM